MLGWQSMKTLDNTLEFSFENIGYEYLLLKFDCENSDTLMAAISQTVQFITEDDYLKANIKDFIPSYATILLHINFLNTSSFDIIHIIERKLNQLTFPTNKSGEETIKLLTIPVCYDEQVAPDLHSVARQLDLSITDVIQLHTSSIYTCFAIGFMPGFGYLGHTPDALHIPRHTTPRLSIPAGSVGLADNHTAIYPNESPGGWQIIGQTTVKLSPLTFDESNKQGNLQVGTQVKFKAITLERFLKDKQVVNK